MLRSLQPEQDCVAPECMHHTKNEYYTIYGAIMVNSCDSELLAFTSIDICLGGHNSRAR